MPDDQSNPSNQNDQGGQDDDDMQKVTVSFNTTTQQFTFSKDSVTMTTPGKIKIVRDDPSNSAWALSNVIFDGGAGPLKIDSKSGDKIVIDDQFTPQQLGTYSYEVQVAYGPNLGSTATSPDPKIVNTNPTL